MLLVSQKGAHVKLDFRLLLWYKMFELTNLNQTLMATTKTNSTTEAPPKPKRKRKPAKKRTVKAAMAKVAKKACAVCKVEFPKSEMEEFLGDFVCEECLPAYAEGKIIGETEEALVESLERAEAQRVASSFAMVPVWREQTALAKITHKSKNTVSVIGIAAVLITLFAGHAITALIIAGGTLGLRQLLKKVA